MPVFVNDVEITDDQVHEEMQHHPAASLEDARYAAAQALVVNELLSQRALKEDYLKTEDATAPDMRELAAAQLLEAHVSSQAADAEICMRYYENNKSKYFDDAGRIIPFEKVEDHIREYLETQSVRNELRQYILGLYRDAKIVGFELKMEENSFH